MQDNKTSIFRPGRLIGKDETKNAYLLILKLEGPGAIGQMTKLEKPDFILGRSSEADLTIDDASISRKHSRIVQDQAGDYFLEDMGSTNGTFLNGDPVNRVLRLKDGDKIQVGSSAILMFSLKDQIEEQFQQNIYESATRDGLTKAFNKKSFVEALNKEIAHATRHSLPLALVMFDVDHFKRVNDNYGHPAGDKVLAFVSEKLHETLRSEDFFARYGGEEFAAILRNLNEVQALRCAERCLAIVERNPIRIGNEEIKVTLSAGVASSSGASLPPADIMISLADEQLYRAKKSGRNRVCGKSVQAPST